MVGWRITRIRPFIHGAQRALPTRFRVTDSTVGGLSGRLISLQVVRAFAALLVAAAHLYGVDQRFFGAPVLPAFAQLGFAGVDLFFVLSGFVMVYVTRHSTGGGAVVPAFLLARAARIYPLWWITLGAISLVWLVRPGWVFASIGGTPNLLADFALWPHDRLPLLAVGWTLIHEMYFYLAFAVALLLPIRLLPVGLLVWMGLVAVSNVALGTQAVAGSPLLALVTHPLTLEFGLGAAAGLLVTRGVRPTPAWLVMAGVAWVVLACVLAAAAPMELFADGWRRVASFGPGWALLLLGLVGLEADRGYVPGRALAGLGDASYALYLIHVPVMAAGARVVSRFCGPAAWDNLLAWAVLLGAAVVAALVLHRWVERPILAWLTRLRQRVAPGPRP